MSKPAINGAEQVTLSKMRTMLWHRRNMFSIRRILRNLNVVNNASNDPEIKIDKENINIVENFKRKIILCLYPM